MPVRLTCCFMGRPAAKTALNAPHPPIIRQTGNTGNRKTVRNLLPETKRGAAQGFESRLGLAYGYFFNQNFLFRLNASRKKRQNDKKQFDE